ncbi:MAG TPA: erythromycin esterase family protein [Bacillota bacterium]|nr:erythromycin esterase family protein [Bacillota bacterium]
MVVGTSIHLIDDIRKHSIRLSDYSDLDVLIKEIGEAKYVLLGEASHGTSEFYTLRIELSKRLIEQKGFSFIAVEGDWPSCYRINRFVKNYKSNDSSAKDAMQSFNRWPTWMWANEELIPLYNWLKEYNYSKSQQNKIGFYGLDVYSLWESMEEIIDHLKQTGSKDLELAIKAFSCFEPFEREGQAYGVSASFFSEDCENEVVELLNKLQEKRASYEGDSEEPLSTEINALVAVNAEQYYRTMVRGGPESWNIRDHHMVDVLRRLMDFHGTHAKAIVWEHNTHIGDARATDMASDGMVNVGQLIREQEGKKKVFAIGFGTHRGNVLAGKSWGAPMEVVHVPPAEPGSWEDAMHSAGPEDKILIFKNSPPSFADVTPHRAIGVVYQPQYERYGNYVPSAMAQRYDGFIHVDKTNALRPIQMEKVLVSD